MGVGQPLGPVVDRAGDGIARGQLGEAQRDHDLTGEDERPRPPVRRAAEREAEVEELERAGEDRDVGDPRRERGEASERAVELLLVAELGKVGVVRPGCPPALLAHLLPSVPRRLRPRGRVGGEYLPCARALSRLLSAAAELHEIADFLGARPPFDAVDTTDLERVEAATEIEFHPAGAVIFAQGSEPVEHLWVVRTGAVEIVHDGRVLDLLGPGELFGHGSMLSGLPTGFTARAAEDALCYRIRADVATPLLARPAGVRFVARSLLRVVEPESPDPPAHTASRPVGELIRSPLVVCAPATSIREAARRMAEAEATAVVVDLGSDGLGILTDRDLRVRVVAGGRDTGDPVSTAMSAPAYTVAADLPGARGAAGHA